MLNVFRAYIRGFIDAEGADVPMEIPPELRDIWIVCIQNRCTTAWQSFDEFVLSAGNIGDRIEAFEMYRRNHRDDAGLGLCDLRQCRDLSRARHAQLEDRHLMFRPQLQ